MKSELRPVESFVMLPPGGPAIIGVLEKRFKDAVVRETVLATNSSVSGQNFISVTLYGPVGYATVEDNALGPNRITPSQIAREFTWHLNGVPMSRSSLYAQNRYGPFGFATGTGSGGDRCLYAWQHIGRHQDQIIPVTGSVGIRLRLCDARASDQELLSVMYGFTIIGYLQSPLWNPYGKPPEVSASLGGLSAPIQPVLPQPERPAQTRTAPVQRPAPPRVTTPIDGPVVPLPEPGSYQDYPAVPGPGS